MDAWTLLALLGLTGALTLVLSAGIALAPPAQRRRQRPRSPQPRTRRATH